MLAEAETLQRMRADTREKGLNALRQLIDEIDAGRYPGLCRHRNLWRRFILTDFYCRFCQ